MDGGLFLCFDGWEREVLFFLMPWKGDRNLGTFFFEIFVWILICPSDFVLFWVLCF